MQFTAPGTCTTPAKMHTFFFEAKGTGNFPQKYAPKPEVYRRSIAWTYYLPNGMKPKRLAWGQQNLEKIWWNTVFSDVALFGLEGNRIKYYETSDLSKIGSELLWVFRTFDGPNIMVPLGFSLHDSNFAKMLRNQVIRSMKDHYRTGDVTLQFLDSLKSQFDSKIVRDELAINSIAVSEWPTSAKDLSPIYHACKLIGEKVKNIPCSSKQEMISILLGMWEKDSDVQMMCSKIIEFLPQIIKSVVERNGNSPRTNVRYVITK
ncbi:Uncharacterized protein GBIM_20677 [Gryllus bimaculatus]|nr:Uncharacterized protein GBIM_20677 [Gryllus bimaculatus]